MLRVLCVKHCIADVLHELVEVDETEIGDGMVFYENSFILPAVFV